MPQPISTSRLYRGYGTLWRSDIALEAFDPADPSDGTGAIAVVAGTASSDRLVLRSINRGHVHADGFHFPWHDEVSFDLFAPRRLVYTPGRRWSGAMPVAFSSTVAALTLAWRGALPFHASAVEIDGHAVLIAGPPGAGKSTLAAQLLSLGARLVGDDLTVVDLPVGEAPILVQRGRASMRLHRDTAAAVAAESCTAIPGDPRHKWLVRPVARTPLEALPLAGFVLLGHRDGPMAPHVAAKLLTGQLFRPRWMQCLPDHGSRILRILAVAARVPVYGVTAPPAFHEHDRLARHVFATLGLMVRQRCAKPTPTVL